MEIIETILKDKNLSDLQITKNTSSSEMKLTEEKVIEAISLLKEIEKNNGYLSIARKSNLTPNQVKEIHRKINAYISNDCTICLECESLPCICVPEE